MEEQELNIDYDNILEALINTFGNVLSKDVYITIIESCGGDLQQSANAVMSITMDGNCASENNDESTESRATNDNNYLIGNQATSSVQSMQPVPNISSTTHNTVPFNTVTVNSYAAASQSIRPPLQQIPKPTMSALNIPQNFWTNQLRQILAHHENGARILIIMRGVPGSGKSFLAKKIIDAMYGTESQENYYLHILSTDQFFMQRGVYVFNKYRLGDAHVWNQNRARRAMSAVRTSPIIIDNTNIECFEMEPYVIEGVRNGYIVEVVEPNTPWARKANQLARRNTHNVPIHTIRRMLDNYENGITGSVLMKRFNCYYAHNMQPPVLRNNPPIIHRPPLVLNPVQNETRSANFEDNTAKEIQERELSQKMAQPTTCTAHFSESISTINVENEGAVVRENKESTKSDVERLQKSDINETDQTSVNHDINQIDDTNEADERGSVNEDYKFTEILRTLEEMERVEKEWEASEDWEDNLKNSPKNDEQLVDSKPQRKNKKSRATTAEKLLPDAEDCQDWSKISMFLPSWDENNSSSVTQQASPVIEINSCGTFVEAGDTDISNLKHGFKIINAIPRNINEFYTASTNSKIPEKWRLDKSTSTNNNELLTDNHRCQHEEQHFESFRKLFKYVARADLRDIFENCCGDVNWAVDIVLDGVENKRLVTVDEGDDNSDTDETNNVELCQCLSAYGILPGNNEPISINRQTECVLSENSDKTSSPSLQMRKVKKDTVVSEASMELKRQIEQNVIIPDSHYSQHCLKIRKIRRCEDDSQGNVNTEKTILENSDKPPIESNITQIPSTSGNRELVVETKNSVVPSTSKADNTETSDDESYVGLEDVENTVNINLGKEFIAQLDQLFGRNMEYPANVNARINMPMSILNEINALWMESLMHQLEEDAKQSELMIQQDEEFARQLAMKEAELSRAGKEPEVPDFKEIMDMDFALSLYHKDVAELRKSKPQDLAAKLSRDKLNNLFPDIPPDILSELLHAHEENFLATVEVLLMSTGKTDVLDEKDGVNKFVMKKEFERQQEKLALEEKKTLSEVEWPLLPKGVKVEMSLVKQFREEADAHLQTRNIHYQKAQEYIRRGMTQVATYYGEVASYHKRKYEQANSLAAASLIQVHAANSADNATIDLHYLRVAEARETLDLFLDSHIQRLREAQNSNNIVQHHTLFFITGRGLHSNGRPKVKPAVQRRLRERGLLFRERNPGLLQARVSADDRLSYQIA